MLTVTKKLTMIRDALTGFLPPEIVHHYKRPGSDVSKYVVWQEDGSNSDGWLDNRLREQQIHGTIDLYTLEEYDPLVDEIQKALDYVMAGWSLQAVEYEDNTNLIHYEWEWNI